MICGRHPSNVSRQHVDRRVAYIYTNAGQCAAPYETRCFNTDILRIASMSSQTLSAKSSNASLLSIDPTPHQELPPSPPASPKPLVPQSVARLLDVLRRREQSTYHHEGEPLRHFRLSPVEYSRFLDALHADQDLWGWYQDKVRYDYNPARSLYILRMPSTTHEYFTQRVVEAILYRIRELAKEEPEIADILLKIKPGGSPTISLQLSPSSSQESADAAKNTLDRSPDATLCHLDYGFRR